MTTTNSMHTNVKPHSPCVLFRSVRVGVRHARASPRLRPTGAGHAAEEEAEAEERDFDNNDG